MTSIGKYAFRNCAGISSVTIPKSVTDIGELAFDGCTELKSITIDSNSFLSKTYAQDSNLQSIFGMQVENYILTDNINKIGDYAFCGSYDLTSITIPNSVTSIGKNSFQDCYGLTSMVIGSGITFIDDEAFYELMNIKDVYCYCEKMSNYGSNLFANAGIQFATLHVPASSVDYYKSLDQWKDFGNIVALTNDDPDPTGIDEMQGSSSKNSSKSNFYDLSGRKSSTLRKGINIIDGKKVIY